MSTIAIYIFFSSALDIPEAASKVAVDNNFELKGYVIEAEREQLRPPKKVRIGVIQNAILLPTNVSVADQRKAIHSRIETILSAGKLCGVNIVCFQEAWSKFRNL